MDPRKITAAARSVAGMLRYRVRRRVVSTVVAAAPRHPAAGRLVPADVRRLASTSEDLAVTVHRARYVVEFRQADVTVWHLAARTATAVADSIEAVGAQPFAMHLPGTRVARWGVRRDRLPLVVDALARDLGGQAFYYRIGRSSLPRPVLDRLTPDELDTAAELMVFQHVRCTTTGALYGATDGCRITVWDESDARGTLVAPDRRSMVQEIDPDAPLATRRRWDGEQEPIIAGSDRDAEAIEFPVDAVYLWVDDSDPQWRARRAAARRELGLEDAAAPADDTLAAHYFRDRGELRASLRSLEAYAPWLRHIYLVTDDQQPDWLDTHHGRVTVVSHREIFADPAVLPTFSSHAIGSQVHRIPGLSDRYLLMNDDVLFTAPVTPYDFFTSAGQLKVFFSRSRRPDISLDRQTPLEQARSRSAGLIERDFGRRASTVFAHVPIPQRKDVAVEVTERYAAEIATTVSGRFRSATDVEPNSWLHLYTALFTGRGVRSAIRYGYYNIGRSEVRERLEHGRYSRGLKVICLNDVPSPDDEQEPDPQWLSGWLAGRFPVPTPYEIQPPPSLP